MGTVQSTRSVEVRSRYTRFGHVLVEARQGQRRDAVANKASAATLSQQEVNDSADVLTI